MYAVPTNLNTDTQQDKGGQAHHHGGSGRPQFLEDALRVAVAEVDSGGDEQDSNRLRERGQEQRTEAGLAPSVSATEIEPGPTVSGIVRG